MSQLFKEGEKGNQETDQDHHLWMTYEKLLVKDGGMRWNSTYYMRRRAWELAGIPITSSESIIQIETKQLAFFRNGQCNHRSGFGRR